MNKECDCCKYHEEEGRCSFFSMGSGNLLDMPCYNSTIVSKLVSAVKYLQSMGWLQAHDKALTEYASRTKNRSGLINRADAIDTILSEPPEPHYPSWYAEKIKKLPDVEPEIIRCKDCRWWDKYDNYDNGYCMAVKHGFCTGRWEISIRRRYKGDFYCADAERRAGWMI